MTARRHKRANQDDRARPRARTDAGQSFVELLVAVVLIGTAVVATLAALRATVIGSALERDHARAQQWLQAAVGAIREADYVPCNDPGSYDSPQDHIVAVYQQAIVDVTTPPPGWSDSQIEILAPVKVWDGDVYWDPNDPDAPKTCFKADGFSLQLITVQVVDTDSQILETVEVVKDDPTD